jgi:hypothetical protein
MQPARRSTRHLAPKNVVPTKTVSGVYFLFKMLSYLTSLRYTSFSVIEDVVNRLVFHRLRLGLVQMATKR